MSAKPDVGKDEEGAEAQRQADAMKDQLSQEVASWSKERRQQLGEGVSKPPQPAVQRRSPRSAGEAGKSSASPRPATSAGARSKPFSMSYDGMTQAEYARYRRDLGSR
jgi:hypothetical protein